MTAVRIESVDWLDARAVALRGAMGVETTAMYAPLVEPLPPEQQAAIARSLDVDPATIVDTILAFDGDEPVGHAALRPFGDVLEVKKVFVPRSHRGRGISRALMLDLERRAIARGVDRLILQTGTQQLAAIALYEKLGYEGIPVFGDYAVMPFERCFAKTLS